jgi:TRAP-type C4-dicarboxylate transport system substrate-binding protein
MFKKFFCIILLLTLLLSVGFSIQAQTHNWKFAHQSVEGALRDVTANVFKEYVEEKTNGDVKVDIYPMQY